jgi:hypothetical protein
MNKTSSKLAAGVRKVKVGQVPSDTATPAQREEKIPATRTAAASAPPRKQPERVWPD